jgi:Family of unknown function (DUF5681)
MNERNYVVGYKMPPQDARFQKGQSGNPRGRVKGRKNYRTEFLDELSEKVTVSENGRRRKLPKQTLVIKRMVADAVKGDAKARDHVLRLIGQVDNCETGSEPAAPSAEADAEIMARFKARLIEEIKLQDHAQAPEDGVVTNGGPALPPATVGKGTK